MHSQPKSEDRPTKSSKAGITVTASGERVIPASVRADGSTRPERRVRPGYRPPEDVEVYKNRKAEAWKTRDSGGVPGAVPAGDSLNKLKNKNAKRRAARKRAKDKDSDTESTKAEQVFNSGEESIKNNQVAYDDTGVEFNQISDTAEKPGITGSEQTRESLGKQAKALKKKIHQANDLKAKKDAGEKLLPEQLEKITKMDEFIRQLSDLGLED